MENKRLIDILPFQIESYPRADALCDKKDGKWNKYNSTEVQEIIDNFSLGLLKSGFKPGDKFAIISGNRTEWTFVDLGILQTGGIDVPIYPTMSSTDYEYIFNDAGVKLVFVEDKELHAKVMKVKSKSTSVLDVYSFNKIEGVKHWSEISALADESLRDRLNEIEANIKGEDLATIIYTSGTTGIPKGVMLTHKNILSNINSLKQIIPIGNSDTLLSFLPVCHIFERTAIYFYLNVGGAVYFAENIDKISENFLEVKPDYFTTVPRLLEKVFEKIMEKGRNLSGIKKAIFGWAVNLANHYDPKGENNFFYNFRLYFARKIVFVKWQEALGGNVKGIISGAATLQPRLARIFTAAGIPIREGYGLTETSPVITCNRFEEGGYYLGTTGLAIPDVQLKIGEDGEILTKGSNVFSAYYNRPEDTAKAFDADGWFHTGDIGQLIEGKFLKITDRKKEVFKTSGGKFVAPLQIENKMKESWFINNIMVIGENRKFTSALIVPDFDFCIKWCKKKGLKSDSVDDLVKCDKLKRRIWKDITKYNKRFSHIEQIKKFELVDKYWTIDDGEITPTLKLKRKMILEIYNDLIEKMYEENKESNTNKLTAKKI
ncbi:MAG: long-chain fatty acid--CoA ligase [Melioribacteraceae bacterium]|nr:long-chain fatty acid--CoA ligase [Melioribacteraceae bacterium]MCF8355302.1 long-chain fatty acid--CoA ligase [Melioribacteraceae bacterium]MCF8394148.1 long-chain fatty acid--CoA ligase [Melioribacteraceae bacterium]MCF8418113.1 long-chain fatty acid--CoA ligase [Melioribacteraceae bacterium]